MFAASRIVGRVARGLSCLPLAVLLGVPFWDWWRCTLTPTATHAPSVDQMPASFTDVTTSAGIAFRQSPGPLGTYFFPEVMGNGGALLDYDSDGDLDVLLLSPCRSPQATGERHDSSSNRLFRQESDGRLTDVTTDSGLGLSLSGIACAVGDIDNDGNPDVYIADFGPDRLYRNRGDGRFEDVTQACGLADDDWTTGVAFFDYDRDGWLDLFVVNYVQDQVHGYSLACNYGNRRITYCGPRRFPPAGDRLLHNEGATAQEPLPRFRDVTVSAGLTASIAAGLSVLCGDLDGDGWDDAYVANDEYPSHLWINRHDGTFADEAVPRGCAVNADGQAQAGMGLAFGDLDGNGACDLMVTHISGEAVALYQNLGQGLFSDETRTYGLRTLTYHHTGWGTAMVDVDHDGNLDLVCVNGHVRPFVTRGGIEPANFHEIRRDRIDDEAHYWADYKDTNQLILNRGNGRLEDVSTLAGDFAATPGNARGLVYGDIDNDGDVDLLVTYVGAQARLYRNDVPKRGHWLQVLAFDPQLRREALGAEITVELHGRQLRRFVTRSGSYLASNDPRVHFGMGEQSQYQAIHVRWPDGTTERFPGGTADRLLVLERGHAQTDRIDAAPTKLE